jgi:hypothetical protein
MAQPPVPSKSRISLDTWAVILGILSVVLIRFGVLKAVPW